MNAWFVDALKMWCFAFAIFSASSAFSADKDRVTWGSDHKITDFGTATGFETTILLPQISKDTPIFGVTVGRRYYDDGFKENGQLSLKMRQPTSTSLTEGVSFFFDVNVGQNWYKVRREDGPKDESYLFSDIGLHVGANGRGPWLAHWPVSLGLDLHNNYASRARREADGLGDRHTSIVPNISFWLVY